MCTLPPGSAVLICIAKFGPPHVWFVLSEPDDQGKVLSVMLCTRRHHSDPTTIFVPGEYAFGDPTEGAIAYGETRLFPLVKLQEWLANGGAKNCAPLSEEQLGRVLAGLRVSGFVPNWVVTYLDDRGLP